MGWYILRHTFRMCLTLNTFKIEEKINEDNVIDKV